ncbi:response regulator transcription factor [Sphingomonas jatrophae]|uniref:RNA polymerase sigma factor, sigma-70 family n=1 Tax=Sphingomonas jatrophae TaxID=1166337 RepID=A0A1I6JNK2_9SPHN|nr:helix-turn-helix transcriptional regulator [Sphingomonas jatrophae]SFR80519.1 RNA polymerase sigma factor, sigma-70 family [Sphingomonas jatrophae]
MTGPRYDQLTPRQRECLRLAYYRLRYQEIAHELGLSPETVKTYLRQAREALGASSTLAAAQILSEREGVPPPPKGGYPAMGIAPPPPIREKKPSAVEATERLSMREERLVFEPSVFTHPAPPSPTFRVAAEHGRQRLRQLDGWGRIVTSIVLTLLLALAVIVGTAVLTDLSRFWLDR